MNMCIETYF